MSIENSATATLDRSPTADLGGKNLTFSLGREEYGLQILKVREIIGYMDVTAVPRTPHHVKGVINLRGQVISVVDLRGKFEMPEVPRTEQTCIIVVETRRAGGRKLSTGIVVDRVCEVLTVTADRIEEPPAFGASVDTDFIVGMGKVGSSVKILLDIDRVLGSADEAPEALAA
jgi:purine-binding chemotaxis protein CheW